MGRPARRHAPGIAPYRGRWRVYVRLHGRYRSKTYPIATPLETLREARDALRMAIRADVQREGAPAPAGPAGPEEPFRVAADRYLASRRSMPTYAERERDIGLWVAEFGDRAIGTIDSLAIATVLERWLLEGPKLVQRRTTAARTPGRRRGADWVAVPGPLAASTVNHRKRALANLVTRLFGRGAANPARQVADYPEPDAPPRAIPLNLVEEVLAAMPDLGATQTRGAARPSVSIAKTFVTAMAWTWLTPAQLEALQEADIDWEGATVGVPRRRKGKGVPAHRRPLTARGLAALQALMTVKAAGGHYEQSVTRRAWRAACAAVARRYAETQTTPPVDLDRLRPYDLRHTAATVVLAQTGDLAAAQALLGHADARTTARYAKAAIPAWLREAVQKVDAAQQAASGGDPPARGAQTPAPSAGRKLHTRLPRRARP